MLFDSIAFEQCYGNTHLSRSYLNHLHILNEFVSANEERIRHFGCFETIFVVIVLMNDGLWLNTYCNSLLSQGYFV